MTTPCQGSPRDQASGFGRRLVPWICGLAAFIISAKKLIGGGGDIGIYLDAAREVGDLQLDIYRGRSDTGPWVYPPFATLPFQWLDGLLGDAGARWAWCAGMGAATVILVRSLVELTDYVGGLRAWQWVVFGVLFQRIIAQNCSHGQFSLWVGAFVAVGVLALVRAQDKRAGLWLGLAAAFKLTPALFLPALPLMRRSRAGLVMLVTVLVAVFLSPLPFWGWGEHVRQLQDFFDCQWMIFTAPEQAAIVADYPGPSVKGTLDYLLQAKETTGIYVNVMDVSDRALFIARLVWSAVLAGVLLWWFRFAGRHAVARCLIERASAVTMAMSFFAPLTRTYHLTAILLPCALFCRGPNSRRDWLWWLCAVGLLFTLTLRQRNLLGEAAWRFLDLSCALHVELLCMVAWLIRASWRDLRGG